jgi:hypothetical protein
LESPIELPALGAKLPLVAFYQVVPVLFVLVHFYVLLQFFLMSRTLHLLNARIDEEELPANERLQWLARIDRFPITQFIARVGDDWLTQLSIRFVVWGTLLIVPIALLLDCQVHFLPYHGPTTTWTHRICLIADMFLIALIWPAAVRAGRPFGGVVSWTSLLIFEPSIAAQPVKYDCPQLLRALRRNLGLLSWRDAIRTLGGMVRAFALMAACAGVAIFSFFVATVPDEGIDRWLTGRMNNLGSNELPNDCFDTEGWPRQVVCSSQKFGSADFNGRNRRVLTSAWFGGRPQFCPRGRRIQADGSGAT